MGRLSARADEMVEKGRGQVEKPMLMQQAQCNSPLPERIPEVPRHIDSLFMQTERLSERIAGLEIRLCSVLTPRPPEDCSKEGDANSTQLGSQLLNLNLRLMLTIEALDSITSRLEL